jgi:hypothetical protein
LASVVAVGRSVSVDSDIIPQSKNQIISNLLIFTAKSLSWCSRRAAEAFSESSGQRFHRKNVPAGGSADKTTNRQHRPRAPRTKEVLMKMVRLLTAVCIWATAALTGFAAEADVTEAVAVRTGPGVYRFSVTVLHQDQGWNHYADRWEVLAPDGRILATRTLYHPHVEEQPFTRRLDGVKIPAAVRKVEIRAHCSVHATGGKTAFVDLAE